MAHIKTRAIDQKYKNLALENQELSREIDELEELLASHAPGSKPDRRTAGTSTDDSTSIWKHGKKGKLYGYRKHEEEDGSTHVNAMSASGGSFRVNRSATALKVKSQEEKRLGDAPRKKEVHSLKVEHENATESTSSAQILVAQKGKGGNKEVKRVTSYKTSQSDICFTKSGGDELQAPVPDKDKRSSSQEKIAEETQGPCAPQKPVTNAAKEAKSKSLQRLMKKAGVEEKLKEFKVDEEKRSDVQSQEPKSSVIKKQQETESRSTGQTVRKEASGRESKLKSESQSADVNKVGKFESNSTTKTKSSTRKEDKSKNIPRVSGLKAGANLSDNDKGKLGKSVEDSNQTKENKSSGIKPKQNTKQVCDVEVRQWLESLRLKEPQKYIDKFAEHEMDMRGIKLLGRNDLREMGIHALGPLNALCLGIEALNKETETEAKKQTPAKKEKKTKVPSVSQGKSAITEMLSPDSSEVNSDSAAEPNSREVRKSSLSSQPGVKYNRSQSAPRERRGEREVQPKRNEPGRPEVKFPAPNATDIPKEGLTDVPAQPKKRRPKRPSSAVAPNQDSAVIDPKILRRPPSARQSITMSVAQIALPDDNSGDVPLLRPATATFGAKKTNSSSKSELDVILQEMTHQIDVLQNRADNDSATTQLVKMLQDQVQEIQQQISAGGAEHLAAKPPSTVRPKTACGTVSAALQGNLRPKKPGKTDAVEAADETKTPTSGSDGKPLNTAMSKQAILKEVRKQQDDYRKQIRHLESELSRIKHQDPLQKCEVEESQIIFSDTDLIGEGAFSRVCRGNFQGSTVAVKQLKIPLSAQDKNYFAAEVQLLRELRHPRVVLLMGVCTTSHLPLMVLEYMNGGSLYSYLHNPELPALDHAAYFQLTRDIALGMNYLHLHKPSVLHLDLKSMNVLLTQELRAKIADFGFSKFKHEADLANQSKVKDSAKGTPAWMAPELLDAKEITSKADVFSFGVVMWEMLTRKQPYQGCSTFQILERIRGNKRPEMPNQCPVGLADLIKKCWDQTPGKRPHFKDILSELDELHFPREWRELFKVAGVPPAALDDVQSTRTLINIVNHTVRDSGLESEQEHQTTEAMERLDLNLLEPHATYRKLDEKSMRESQAWSEVPIHSGYPVDVFSNPHHFEIDDTDAKVGPSTPPTPPPVPSLIPSSLTSSAMTSHPDSTSQGSLASGFDKKSCSPNQLQGHDLVDQKAKLRPSAERKYRMLTETTANTDGAFMVRATELQEQKDLLKPTSLPHPNQLVSLSSVHPERLTGLADILKKAVNERRVALETGDSVDASMSASSWSNYDD